MSNNNIDSKRILRLVARQNAVMKRIENGGLSIEVALDGTQAILDGKFFTATTSSTKLKSVTDEQIRAAQMFYSNYGSTMPGYLCSDVPEPPIVELRSDEIMLLYAPLPTFLETIAAYWQEAKPPTGYTKEQSKELKINEDCLRLLPGTTFDNNIQWVIFNPVANQGRSPKECVDSDIGAHHLAHVHVLMALYYFKDWAASWNRENSPFPNMTGLQSRPNKNCYWNDTPHVHCWESGKQLRLNTSASDVPFGHYCSPTYKNMTIANVRKYTY